MKNYSLSHLSDQTLLRDLASLVARDRVNTAALLAHIAEVDARKLYLPAGFPSMHAYCVDELRLSEDAAYKRIQAARAAREFPVLFAAVAEGRLHLAAVCLLAPHLTPGNGDELLAAAVHRRKSEIERWLAGRFPRTEVLTMVEIIPETTPVASSQLAPGQVADVSETPAQLAPGQVGASVPRSKVAPVSSGRFLLQVTIGMSTHDKLQYAQSLLSHSIPTGDVAQVIERALDALIPQLEKRKFAATSASRCAKRSVAERNSAGSVDGRHIPADVKRAVWARDGGQCTFVSETGKRCASRAEVEFDHIDPVARGGRATAGRVRLLCRAHNQYEAERVFGVAFMNGKRQSSRRDAAKVAPPGVAKAGETQGAQPGEDRDVSPWLRKLGFRSDEVRRGVAACMSIPDAPLEQRVRLALCCLAPPHRKVTSHLGSAT